MSFARRWPFVFRGGCGQPSQGSANQRFDPKDPRTERADVCNFVSHYLYEVWVGFGVFFPLLMSFARRWYFVEVMANHHRGVCKFCVGCVCLFFFFEEVAW
jgi:hypothetical protein